jgi:hypothetical protein
VIERNPSPQKEVWEERKERWERGTESPLNFKENWKTRERVEREGRERVVRTLGK